MNNVELNGLSDHVQTLSCAAHSRDGYYPFNYGATHAGASASQLASIRDSKERRFDPAAKEIKHGVRIDTLIYREVMRPPDLVKLDVDGNEHQVLRGLERALRCEQRPRAVQVEVNRRGKRMVQYLAGLGYEVADRHYTFYQARQVESGMSPERAGYNGLFRSS